MSETCFQEDGLKNRKKECDGDREGEDGPSEAGEHCEHERDKH